MSPAIGPVILDLMGPELRPDERELLQHPLVGGVILFSRHYESPEQIEKLCREIRAARSQPLLISVDQEGGRVQRFREGFTRLPSMGRLGKCFQTSENEALEMAHACGWLMASELLAVGIDLSLAPVLDLDKNICPAIGDRAFASNPAIVIALASAIQQGMRSAGMASTGKHFPGHGSVAVDSHLEIPIDHRHLDKIAAEDLIPFVQMIRQGINAMMPAHIIFPEIDDKPVGYSSTWLKEILRHQLQFSGLIFSDDLNMQGANIGTKYSDRALAALNAGCDMVLICNNRPAALEILETLSQDIFLVHEKRFATLQGKFSHHSLAELKTTSQWQEQHQFVTNFSTQEIS